jgi:hypothetical protein
LNYGVYIGKSVDSGKFSVAWCQTVGLVGVVGREGGCSRRCSFEERCFVWEEILTCGSEAQEDVCMSQAGERKGKKVQYVIR